MTIEFRCPECGKLFRGGDHLAGKKTRCTGCSTIIPIPGEGSSTPKPAPPRRPPQPEWEVAEDEEADAEVPIARLRKPRGKPRKGRKRGLLLASLAVLLVVLLGGASFAVYLYVTRTPAGLAGYPKYLPEDCGAVIKVRVAELVQSGAYQEVQKAIPAWIMALLTQYSKDSPIGASEIAEMIAAVPASDPEQTVAIMKFTRPVTADEIKQSEKQRKYTSATVGKYQVFEDRDQAAFCVVENNVVLAGKPIAVRKILERNRKAPISAGLKDALKLVDSSRTMFLAMDVKEMLAKAPRNANAALATAPDPLKQVKAFGMDVAVGADVSIEMAALCTDSKKAEELRTKLIEFVGMAKAIPQLPAEVRTIVDSIALTTSGNRVNGKVRFQVGPLVQLAKGLIGNVPGLPGLPAQPKAQQRPAQPKKVPRRQPVQ